MADRIQCTAMEAATTYRDLIGSTHLVRFMGKRGGWSYYDKIKVPYRAAFVRVQREYMGEYMTSRWNAQDVVELVPVEDVPKDKLPDNYSEADW